MQIEIYSQLMNMNFKEDRHPTFWRETFTKTRDKFLNIQSIPDLALGEGTHTEDPHPADNKYKGENEDFQTSRALRKNQNEIELL